MSDSPQPERFMDRIRGHWQFPLLVLSLVVLGLGTWRLVPEPDAPTFEHLYAQADDLRAKHLYQDASLYIEELLSDPIRTEDEQRQLYGLMANVLFEFELGNVVHGPKNSEGIIGHSDRSVTSAEELLPEMHRRRGLAFEWLRREDEAVREYQSAIDKGVENPWRVRKRMLEVQQASDALTEEGFHESYDLFLTSQDVPDDLVCWAADQKVTLFDRVKRYTDAETFLAKFEDRFKAMSQRDEFEYLQSKIWYYLGRYQDAEAQLRLLQDRVEEGNSLYARSGWLLGRILQDQHSPETARSFYEDVIERTVASSYRVASRFGRAETLGELQRYTESVEEFKAVVQLTSERPYGVVVDLREVRESAQSFYLKLSAADRLEDALAYLRVAAGLIGPADDEAKALYADRLATLTSTLGDRASAAASEGEKGQGANAKAYYEESAGHFLKLAEAASLDSVRSSDATWKAADAYDNAELRMKAAEVLEQFLADRPRSSRAPEALLRLGQTYQSTQQFDKARERYLTNLENHPTTPSAARSVVPLAQCFIAEGKIAKAEEQLLRLVNPKVGDTLTLLVPDADEYRDSLFTLGDLYIDSEQYEKAIVRYEESRERYPTDPRLDRATFMLAEAYRKSADRIYDDIQEPENIAYREDLQNKFRARLAKAGDLYGEVIDRYRNRSSSALTDLDELYVKLSHFRQADSVYDRSRIDGASDPGIYAKAVEIYDRAALAYQDDPLAMSAYVQMISCHIRMGNTKKARMVLERAKWALRSVLDENFVKFSPPERRRPYWQEYLQYLETTPTFRLPTS